MYNFQITQKRNQFYHLRSHLAFPRACVMIFIFIFGMTMLTFAWANMGSLRGHNFGQIQFYYATPTQKSFFCQKKAVFFRCHASRF